MKSMKINDRYCQVSFEEEVPSASTFGSPFHKWGVASEEESEAHLDISVCEDFSESECSELDDKNGERRGEDKIFSFRWKGKSIQKVAHALVEELILLGRVRMMLWN